MRQSWSNTFGGRWLGALVAALAVASVAVAADKPADAAECTEGELQAKVDSAAPGAVVDAPACIYREKITIGKPITLKADPGAEIRGSDIWTGWTKSGEHWKDGPLPAFNAHGRCSAGTERCLWPEQVFLDGKPLKQVASDPAGGQFAVDAERNVVLADDPTGHTVEVTTRREWIVGRSDEVTIRGFTMKHAANDSQNGALENGGYSRWEIQDNKLSQAHGAVVSLTEGTDLNLLNNDIYRGGQLGVHVSTGDVLVQGNRIHDNNTEGFDPAWEAGGMKTAGVLRAGGTHSLLANRNKVYRNDGKGFWCDTGCTNVTYSNNRVHHNKRNGIQLEITDGAKVFGNVVWENGWDKSVWGWGAGILSLSSKNVEIYDNVVAWNTDGISVVSTDREGTFYDNVVNVRVHHNTILHKEYPSAHFNSEQNYALGWLQDWAGVLFDASSNNRGYDNKYWYITAESNLARYAWSGGKSELSQFSPTPGEERGRYLSNAEKKQVVSSARIPASPEPR